MESESFRFSVDTFAQQVLKRITCFNFRQDYNFKFVSTGSKGYDQGATIAFCCRSSTGLIIGHTIISRLAASAGIQVPYNRSRLYFPPHILFRFAVVGSAILVQLNAFCRSLPMIWRQCTTTVTSVATSVTSTTERRLVSSVDIPLASTNEGSRGCSHLVWICEHDERRLQVAFLSTDTPG